MDGHDINFRQILTDVQAIPSLSIYLNFEYSDESFNKCIKVEHDKRYRVIYVENRQLTRVVGIVTDISKIYKPDIYEYRQLPPEYLITIDCSTEYGSNIKKIKSLSIRDIVEFVRYMDDDTKIEDAETTGGISIGDIKNVVIMNAEIDEDEPKTPIVSPDTDLADAPFNNSGGIIHGGTIITGVLTGDTKEGITCGNDVDNHFIYTIKGITTGGSIDEGKIIRSTIDIRNGAKYKIFTEEDGSKTFYGSLKDVIANNTHIMHGESKGGIVVDPKITNSIVYGGNLTGKDMVTTGGVTKGDITYNGKTKGGTVTGGDSIGNLDPVDPTNPTDTTQQIHIIDGVTTGGISTGTIIRGGTVIGGTSVGNVIYGATVIGGEGIANITTGGKTVGGKISYKAFDISHYMTDDKTDATEQMKQRAIDIANKAINDSIHNGYNTNRNSYFDIGWQRIPNGLVVTWDDINGIRSNITDKKALITDRIARMNPNRNGFDIEYLEPEIKSRIRYYYETYLTGEVYVYKEKYPHLVDKTLINGSVVVMDIDTKTRITSPVITGSVKVVTQIKQRYHKDIESTMSVSVPTNFVLSGFFEVGEYKTLISRDVKCYFDVELPEKKFIYKGLEGNITTLSEYYKSVENLYGNVIIVKPKIINRELECSVNIE